MDDTEPLGFYPNPASNYISITSPNKNGIKFIEIYNAQGQLKLRVQPEISDKIDISNLSKGVYLVKIITDKKVSVSKLIKE